MTRDEAAVFSKVLIGSPHARLIDVLTRKPDREFTKKEIAEEVGIGRTTLYRIWDDLERMNALTPTRKVGAVTLYRLNRESPATQSIQGIRERLKIISKAVADFENDRLREGSADLRNAEADPLSYLGKRRATSPSGAVQLPNNGEAKKKAENLIQLGLIAKNERGYYLTQLGQYAASGSRSSKQKPSQDGEVLSSIDVALQVINQEIKKLKSGMRVDEVMK